MNLLTLLNELEPDAGWQDAASESIAGLGAAKSADRFCEMHATASKAVKVSLFKMTTNATEWIAVCGFSEDRCTALKMALTGYRAGETP